MREATLLQPAYVLEGATWKGGNISWSIHRHADYVQLTLNSNEAPFLQSWKQILDEKKKRNLHKLLNGRSLQEEPYDMTD